MNRATVTEIGAQQINLKHVYCRRQAIGGYGASRSVSKLSPAQLGLII